MHPTFREVMSRSGFYKLKSDNRKETHYLIDGGKLIVPSDMENEFLRLYSEYVSTGGRAYVVSLRTAPVFRLFFDVDAHVLAPPDDDWYVRLAKYTLTTLKELFESADSLYVIVCTTDSKEVRKNGVGCLKYGVHLHVPMLHVSESTALHTRNALVQKISNYMGERPSSGGPTTWKDDIDENVFRGTGLRVNHSRKLVQCPSCKGIQRDGCGQCLGSGKIDEGRAYTGLLRLNADFTVDYLIDSPMLDMLIETNIRSTETSPSHALHAQPPCWMEIPGMPGTLDVRSRGKKRSIDTSLLTEGHADIETGIRGKQPFTPAETEQVQKWLWKQVRDGNLPKEYARVTIQGFTCMARGSSERTKAFARMHSQYCANIGRSHESNTVYIEIDGRNRCAYMKCFCRCQTTEGRRMRAPNGRVLMCKDYRSQPLTASSLCDAIFGISRSNSASLLSALCQECT